MLTIPRPCFFSPTHVGRGVNLVGHGVNLVGRGVNLVGRGFNLVEHGTPRPPPPRWGGITPCWTLFNLYHNTKPYTF